jgi:hypothetical protein
MRRDEGRKEIASREEIFGRKETGAGITKM